MLQPETMFYNDAPSLYQSLVQASSSALKSPGLWSLPDRHKNLSKISHFCYTIKIFKKQGKQEMTTMNLTIFDQPEQMSQGSLAIDAASLYKAFEQVKDGRGKKGKRYPLALLLTGIMLGKMAGETKIEGIIDWINERKKEIKRLLNWPKDFPTNKTYTYALTKCDHHEIAKAIAQVILKARAIERCGDESSRLLAQKRQEEEIFIHTALDGKVVRGTLNHERENQSPVHLLSFYDCASGIVLDQFSVSRKNNEQSACVAILHPVLVKGRIITADSIFSCKKWCAIVVAYDGHYMLPIKENTPVVLKNLTEFFDDKEGDRSDFHYHKEVNKGHGRLEVREIWTSTQMNEVFEKDWAGIAQVFMIRRTIKAKGEERIEVVYGITSVPRKIVDAKRLLELNRKHWFIENRLHYRRDVSLGEDASQIRVNGAPEVLAALNGGLLAFMDFLGVKNVAKQMRHYCAQPQEALQVLLGKLSRENG
jgi:predicted transposase YbfD/YdcC